MTEKEETIRKLKTFEKRRHKQSAFIDVDLDIYQEYVDLCINELITEIERKDSPGRKKNILKKYLFYIRKMNIGETVEREYVCMEFFDLSQIVSVDVGFYLEKTLYGSILAFLSLISRKFRKSDYRRTDNGIREQFELICLDCQYKMIGWSVFYESDGSTEVDQGVTIVECPVCGGYNLVYVEEREGYRGCVSGDYRLVDDLSLWPQDDYSERRIWSREDAEQRLQQVRYWKDK